jgi:Glycosyl transferases group 1
MSDAITKGLPIDAPEKEAKPATRARKAAHRTAAANATGGAGEAFADRRERSEESTSGRLRVLFLSPFSPVPTDAGQRKRVHQTLQLLKDAGLSVSLLLYPFEGAWAWRFQQDVADRLRQEYDDVLILPANRTVGAAPRQGVHHSLDEWWDDLLGNYLLRLFETCHFDVLLVNNVWLSKALTLVPPCVVKVIDMHDLFHLRERSYNSGGIVPEFFRITERDELFGLNRADICVSISLTEAKHLADIIAHPKVVYLPYASSTAPAAPPDPTDRQKECQYLSKDKVVFGFLGTNHTFNIAGVASLLEELCTVISENFAPIELVFAGTVCDSIRQFDNRIRLTRLGWMEDEDEFFDRIDFCIVPVFHGSGFKIKVADILERGKPALFSEHAAEGLSLDRTLLAANAGAMAAAMSEIAFNRPPLRFYANLMDQSRRNLTDSVKSGTKSFLSTINQCTVECIIDLRTENGPHKLLTLLSVATLARELKDLIRVRILVDRLEAWPRMAASHLPPSVSVECGWRSEEEPGTALNRVWWRFGSTAGTPVRSPRTIRDLRFATEIRDGDLSHEVLLSPGQAMRCADLTAANWSCLPYLTDSLLWDPVARAILADADADADRDPPDAQTIIIADGGHGSGLPHHLLARLGLDVKLVDLRDGRETSRLLAALYRKGNSNGKIAKILDGCDGGSPARDLVLEMAIVCNVRISTGALGLQQEITDDLLEEWRTRKAAEDRAAFQNLLREFDAMRGRLRRL